jgi:hypothetical protein
MVEEPERYAVSDILSGMRAVVTGGSGFLDSYLFRRQRGSPKRMTAELSSAPPTPSGSFAPAPKMIP